MSAISPRRSPRRRSIPSQHGGKTYEIGGPQVMTMRELQRGDPAKPTGQTPELVDMPDFIAPASVARSACCPARR